MNRGRVSVSKRAYYQLNRAKLIAKAGRYRACKREEIKAKKSAYYLAHREEILAERRAARKAPISLSPNDLGLSYNGSITIIERPQQQHPLFLLTWGFC